MRFPSTTNKGEHLMAKQPLIVVLLIMTVAIAAAHAFDHEHFRVIGTITKLQKTEFDVKDKEGKTTSVYIDKQTKVTRDKKPVAATTLKVGQSVVVDAYGDDVFDLLALEIRIVPPITSTKTK